MSKNKGYIDDTQNNIINVERVLKNGKYIIVEKDEYGIRKYPYSTTSSISVSKKSRRKSEATINGRKITFIKRKQRLNITPYIKNLINNQAVLKTLYGTALIMAAGVTILAAKQNKNVNEPSKNIAIENTINNEEYHSLIPIKCYHKMQGGDTLWGIATSHGINISDIKGVNNHIDPNNIIQRGEEITYYYYVREDQIKYATDLVEYDKSLESLAKQYNTDIGTIKRLNENHYDINTILVPNFKGLSEINEEYEQDLKTQKTKIR